MATKKCKEFCFIIYVILNIGISVVMQGFGSVKSHKKWFPVLLHSYHISSQQGRKVYRFALSAIKGELLEGERERKRKQIKLGRFRLKQHD